MFGADQKGKYGLHTLTVLHKEVMTIFLRDLFSKTFSLCLIKIHIERHFDRCCRVNSRSFRMISKGVYDVGKGHIQTRGPFNFNHSQDNTLHIL